MDFEEYVAKNYTPEEQNALSPDQTYAQALGFPDDEKWIEETNEAYQKFCEEKHIAFPSLCYGFIMDEDFKQLFMGLEFSKSHEQFQEVLSLFLQTGFIKGAQYGEFKAARDRELRRKLEGINLN